MTENILSHKKRADGHKTILERNATARKNRTPVQQLELLDKRLGKDTGAKRERTRLNTLITKK